MRFPSEEMVFSAFTELQATCPRVSVRWQTAEGAGRSRGPGRGERHREEAARKNGFLAVFITTHFSLGLHAKLVKGKFIEWHAMGRL